jgi:4-carboxymuconolactone decarboxylase
MARIADLDILTLGPDQARIYSQIVRGPRGAVAGPLRIWMRNPGLADRAQALGAYCRYDTSLPERLSELAIVVVGAHWRAGFEWAVHAPLALKAGIKEEILEAIRTGRTPEFAKDDEHCVFALSKELLVNKRLGKETFDEALTLLGLTTLIDLVGILGYYSLISMTINAFEVDLPVDHSDPFP